MADFAQELASQIPRLRRYARALTHDASWADDLVQDALERALRRRWLFRVNSNLTAWLFTILYRLYLNDATRRQITTVLSEEEMAQAAVTSDASLQLDIERALARLSPEHRAVIVLIALEQMSYKDAAAVLGIPTGTVMSRLARARELLRISLSAASPRTTADAGPAHLIRIK